MPGTDTGYRIIDEPAPRRGPRIAVNPFWPLFATVLTGILPGVLWFLYNGAALGSATRRRELAVGAAGVLGSLALAFALTSLRPSVPAEVFPYAGLLLVGWKVTIGYVLYIDQSRSLELFEHFGGRPGKGFLLLILVIAVSVFGGGLAHLQSPILGALFGEGFFLS